MRKLPGFSPMRLALVLTGSFFVAVVAVALIATRSGGDVVQAAPNTTPSSEAEPVKIVIAGTNDALEEQTDGGIVGEGTFRATGGIRDRGWARAHRAVPNKNLILLRYVTKGRKGAITYVVDIHIERLPPVSRWRIESATKAYKGLQGKGLESENANYTVSFLKGKVWR